LQKTAFGEFDLVLCKEHDVSSVKVLTEFSHSIL